MRVGQPAMLAQAHRAGLGVAEGQPVAAGTGRRLDRRIVVVAGHQPRQSGRFSSSSSKAHTRAAMPITCTSTVSARASTSFVTPQILPLLVTIATTRWRRSAKRR
jgi:hypothetical protein